MGKEKRDLFIPSILTQRKKCHGASSCVQFFFPIYTLMCIFKIGSLWVFLTLTLASKYPMLNTQPKQTTTKKTERILHI